MVSEVVAESCDCLFGQCGLAWVEVLAAELRQDSGLEVEPPASLVEELVVVKLDRAPCRLPTAPATAVEVCQGCLQRQLNRPLVVRLLADLFVVRVDLVEVSDTLWQVRQEASERLINHYCRS